MNILAIIEGIISSVPEAIQLYHKIAPLINAHADIPQEQIDEVNSLVPSAHAAVIVAHDAISNLIEAHAPVAPPAA